MMRFAYAFAGGAAFYPALVVVFFALFLLRFSTNRSAAMRVTRIAIVLAAVLVVASAIPLPFWIYLFWLVSVVAALWLLRARETQKSSQKNVCFAVALIVTVVMAALEIPHRIAPSIPFTKDGVLYTLGDSLSMGADSMDGNWPALLAERAEMKVHAFAFGGARLSTAMSNADRVENDASLIIVELGGNDIFYDTPSSQFAAELDEMLQRLTRHGAPVVMLELPLPPFYNRFGSAQRRLANNYGVLLVPRKLLARVLSTPDATVDGLHLSNAGHQMLADALWELRAK